MVGWEFGKDLLVLFTDGLPDQANDAGERYGETRIVERIERDRARNPSEIVESVYADLAEFGGTAGDDRTLLVMRM
jgi:phosphoserine phosphatase RsbU/P